MYVLLVDDSDLVRGFAKELLVEAGHEVLETRDANAALQIAAEHAEQIALLIVDVLLRGASGLELARQMRGQLPDLKVLLVSADPGNAAAAAMLANARFLDKTRMVDELAETVARLLSST